MLLGAMSSSMLLFILFGTTVQVHATDSPAGLDSFVDKMVERMLTASNLHPEDLNVVTLAKPGQLASRAGPSAVSAIRSPPLTISHFPLLGNRIQPFADIKANANVPINAEVVIGQGDNFEAAMKKFKRDANQNGHIQQVRTRRYFENAVLKRRRKVKEMHMRKKGRGYRGPTYDQVQPANSLFASDFSEPGSTDQFGDGGPSELKPFRPTYRPRTMV
eukprot:gnl/MRDRNA2_/MRDRNA2_89044_c0_seq1.p1 gnl/MRDRNA2_/MRDRNA2_89044_c0~~gnl/MRDRNA2_/MRDRNA2_89044_c0_seq1.p1  ORF type:complete len:218 (-),score=21.14 gnl/MRDRNA2_/MRDRNA2_89044_c0_seq1:29-682(-)